MALKFYGHPLSSYCWKVLIALYENGTPFEYELLDFGDAEAAARFAELWPMGKMPVVVDGERVIPEGSIIIEHLDRAFPGRTRFIPQDPDEAREARSWDRFYDLYLQGPLQKIVFDHLRPDGTHDAFGVEQAYRDYRTAYGVAEAAMKGRTWAAGEAFTLADCAAAPALYYGDKVSPFRATHPALAAYLDRLKARPSFARVLAEAEPYKHNFPLEPKPEPQPA